MEITALEAAAARPTPARLLAVRSGMVATYSALIGALALAGAALTRRTIGGFLLTGVALLGTAQVIGVDPTLAMTLPNLHVQNLEAWLIEDARLVARSTEAWPRRGAASAAVVMASIGCLAQPSPRAWISEVAVTDALAIRTQGLTRRFGARTAVDALDLEVARTIRLPRPNGAGATTTIRMLLGLSPADAGEAWILGHHFQERAAICQRVGHRRDASPRRPARDRQPSGLRLDERTATLHPATWRPCSTGGLRRGREAVGGYPDARACSRGGFVHDPELFFLDEPTNGLDPRESDAQLRGLLTRARPSSCRATSSTKWRASAAMGHPPPGDGFRARLQLLANTDACGCGEPLSGLPPLPRM